MSAFRFAEFEVDFAKRELRKHGERIHLQPKPFQILQMLLHSPGEVVTREAIAQALWPGLHVCFERSLNTAVNVLRSALGNSQLIETRSRLGYVFVGKVERLEIDHDFLKGRYLLEKMTEAAIRKAIAHFEAAAAFGAAAEAYCELARYSSASIENCQNSARECCRRAPEAKLAHARVKMLFDGEAELSIPESVEAHRLNAQLSILLGRHDDALNHIRAARRAEPVSMPVGVDFALTLFARDEFNSAAEECWKLLSLEPQLWWAQLILGLSYRAMGAAEEAGAELQNATICSENHPLTVAAASGDVVDAKRIIFGCIPIEKWSRLGRGAETGRW